MTKLATQKVLIALAPDLLERINAAAKYESKTRSDFIRDALRERLGLRYPKQNFTPPAKTEETPITEQVVSLNTGAIATTTGPR